MLLPFQVCGQGQAVSPALQFWSPGKSPGRRSLAAMGAGRDCKLLFITDTLSGWRLLVNSRAQRSILPAKPVDTMAGVRGPPMDAANGTPIRTYGIRYVQVCFGGRRFLAGILSWPACLRRSWGRISSALTDCWWMLQTAA